jgi:hypothetical protein
MLGKYIYFLIMNYGVNTLLDGCNNYIYID